MDFNWIEKTIIGMVCLYLAYVFTAALINTICDCI